ncbi:MAG: EamA family transporter [Armatimonadota bacterium]
MPWAAILMLLVAVSLGAAGQMCLKLGVNALDGGGLVTVLKGIFTPYVFSGFILYGLSSVVYLMALSKLDLSYAYPFVALSFVMVTVLSWKLLDETLPALRVVGLVLIMGGVLTVAASYHGHAAPAAAVEQPLEQSR